jgi:hypothetical protein
LLRILLLSALLSVGTSQAPARSDDGRSVVLFPHAGAITAVGPAGRVDARELPCTARQLRYPRLVLACPAPSVMNVRTGSVQTPPDPPAPDGAWATFFRAGRYWLQGVRTYPDGGGSMPVLRHRYTGYEFEFKGSPDLDSSTPHIEPMMLGSVPMTTYRCPRRCFALVARVTDAAYVKHHQLRYVSLPSGRVLRSWRLPARRERTRLLLAGHNLYASVLVNHRWHVYRGALPR